MPRPKKKTWFERPNVPWTYHFGVELSIQIHRTQAHRSLAEDLALSSLPPLPRQPRVLRCNRPHVYGKNSPFVGQRRLQVRQTGRDERFVQGGGRARRRRHRLLYVLSHRGTSATEFEFFFFLRTFVTAMVFLSATQVDPTWLPVLCVPSVIAQAGPMVSFAL